MSRPELVQIPHDRIDDVWPLIADRVERGVRNTRGRYTVAALRAKLQIASPDSLFLEQVF